MVQTTLFNISPSPDVSNTTSPGETLSRSLESTNANCSKPSSEISIQEITTCSKPVYFRPSDLKGPEQVLLGAMNPSWQLRPPPTVQAKSVDISHLPLEGGALGAGEGGAVVGEAVFGARVVGAGVVVAGGVGEEVVGAGIMGAGIVGAGVVGAGVVGAGVVGESVVGQGAGVVGEGVVSAGVVGAGVVGEGVVGAGVVGEVVVGAGVVGAMVTGDLVGVGGEVPTLLLTKVNSSVSSHSATSLNVPTTVGSTVKASSELQMFHFKECWTVIHIP